MAKTVHEKKITGNLTRGHRCTNLDLNVCKLNVAVYKRIIHYYQVDYIPGIQGWFNIRKSSNIVHYATILKKKIITSFLKKVFDEI